MPQYVMCLKHNCPKTKECYRYLAVPDKEQLFNDFPLICNENDNYYLHMKIRPDDKVRDLESIEILKLEEDEKKEG